MLLTDYDEAYTMELFKKEGYEEGYEEGFEIGRREGILEALIGFVRDGCISKERAASLAQMTINEFEAEMKKAQ